MVRDDWTSPIAKSLRGKLTVRQKLVMARMDLEAALRTLEELQRG